MSYPNLPSLAVVTVALAWLFLDIQQSERLADCSKHAIGSRLLVSRANPVQVSVDKRNLWRWIEDLGRTEPFLDWVAQLLSLTHRLLGDRVFT